MKAKDVYIPGYGYLDVILAHYVAIPQLVHTVGSFNPSPSDWYNWDQERSKTFRFSDVEIEDHQNT